MRLRLLETCLWGVVGWGGVIADRDAGYPGEDQGPPLRGGDPRKTEKWGRKLSDPRFLKKTCKIINIRNVQTY